MRWAKSHAVVAIFCFFISIASQVGAAPPKVVKAVPDNGDIGVDPNLKEIRITFDQLMADGMSLVGGGETYPKVLGKPKWTTARTLGCDAREKAFGRLRRNCIDSTQKRPPHTIFPAFSQRVIFSEVN